jgi:hypothetical protein
MKTNQTFATGLSVDLFGVDPSGCQPPSSSLKRGHRTVALPPEPDSFNLRTKLSALLVVIAALTTSSLLLCPASAHAQGGVPLWTNRYDGPANDADPANAIAVDRSGNVFVTGSSFGVGTSSDYATIKYSNSGVPLWTNRYTGLPGIGNDEANAIALDSNGSVFVTGYSWKGTDYDYATIKYSNSGVPLWTNYYDSATDTDACCEQGTSIAVDASGNVFVTGHGGGNNTTVAYSNSGVPLWTNSCSASGGYPKLALDGSGNVFVPAGQGVVKYSNGGMPLWTNANVVDGGPRIALDSGGNLFVTGTSGSGGATPDFVTVKSTGAGVPLWTNRYTGPPGIGSDGANAIAVDSSGNVFVTGTSGEDYATLKYSNAGVPLWTNRYSAGTHSYAIAVDSSGNVFVTGDSWSGNTGDYATVAYSNAGLPLWTNRYHGPVFAGSIASAIAVDSAGNVFVTGFSWNATSSDFATIKYSSSVPPPRLDFQLLSNQLVLSWTNAGFTLQSAPAITGTFTNLPGATSPYTSALSGLQQFFRLKRE